MSLSEYRAMWLMAMFDLPVDTKNARGNYTRFRQLLLREGFTMLQYSVYARYCTCEETAVAYRRRIRAQLPPDGQVRLIAITDRQFGRMEVYFGKNRRTNEPIPDQLMLF